MQGAWWELKIRLESEEYEKLKGLALHAGKDISGLVREIILRFLETSSADAPSSSE